MIFTTLLSLGFAVSAAAEPLIAGLGSSYAAGPGLDKPIGEILRERLTSLSGQNYFFSNLAVSGSVLGDIPKSQASGLNHTEPDIIYVVSGGNDLNYVACLFNPTSSPCPAPVTEDDYKQRYSTALDSIYANIASEDSTIVYVVTYIQALGPETACSASNADCTFTASEVQQDSSIYTQVVDWTVSAFEEYKSKQGNGHRDVRLIPMREYSAGHQVGSTEPWINGAEVPSGAGGIIWHPNNAGANAVAEFIISDYVTSRYDC